MAKIAYRYGMRLGDRSYYDQVWANFSFLLLLLPILIAILIYFEIPDAAIFFGSVLYFPVGMISTIVLTLSLYVWGRAVPTHVHNERTKLTASFLDRIATLFLTVGVATPLAATYLNMEEGKELVLTPAAELGVLSGLGAGLTLHWVARIILGGLRDKT